MRGLLRVLLSVVVGPFVGLLTIALSLGLYTLATITLLIIVAGAVAALSCAALFDGPAARPARRLA